MDTSSVLKSLTFDKILINTFRRCSKSIDFQVANDILNTDAVTFFNSSLNYAIEIFPDEYNFTSNPSFDEQEKNILEMFYGEKDESSKKEEIKEEKKEENVMNSFDLREFVKEFVDTPKNRQALIGFAVVLFICYLLLVIFSKSECVPTQKLSKAEIKRMGNKKVKNQ